MAAYLAKISGPLLDRIDLHIEVHAVPLMVLTQDHIASEPSAAIKQRVVKARTIQRRRLKRAKLFANAQMSHRDLTKFCPLSDAAKTLLHAALHELRFSARAHDKILRLARTIADLASSDPILPDHPTPCRFHRRWRPAQRAARLAPSRAWGHLAEALQYRSLDRQLWV